jgi:hypothetical protein
MAKWGAERLAAASGILFVALFLAGILAPGEEPPNLHDPNTTVVAFFMKHHHALLASSILLSLAYVAFLWFLGSLGAALRLRGEPRLAAVAFGGGVSASALAYLAVVIQAAITFRTPADSAPGNIEVLYDMQFITTTIVSFPVAVLVGAVSIASWRSRVFPQWFGAAGLLVALVVLVSGGALDQRGFYAPDGAYAIISLIVFLAWTLAASAFLVMRPLGDKTPEAVTAPTA